MAFDTQLLLPTFCPIFNYEQDDDKHQLASKEENITSVSSCQRIWNELHRNVDSLKPNRISIFQQLLDNAIGNLYGLYGRFDLLNRNCHSDLPYTEKSCQHHLTIQRTVIEQYSEIKILNDTIERTIVKRLTIIKDEIFKQLLTKKAVEERVTGNDSFQSSLMHWTYRYGINYRLQQAEGLITAELALLDKVNTSKIPENESIRQKLDQQYTQLSKIITSANHDDALGAVDIITRLNIFSSTVVGLKEDIILFNVALHSTQHPKLLTPHFLDMPTSHLPQDYYNVHHNLFEQAKKKFVTLKEQVNKCLQNMKANNNLDADQKQQFIEISKRSTLIEQRLNEINKHLIALKTQFALTDVVKPTIDVKEDQDQAIDIEEDQDHFSEIVVESKGAFLKSRELMDKVVAFKEEIMLSHQWSVLKSNDEKKPYYTSTKEQLEKLKLEVDEFKTTMQSDCGKHIDALNDLYRRHIHCLTNGLGLLTSKASDVQKIYEEIEHWPLAKVTNSTGTSILSFLGGYLYQPAKSTSTLVVEGEASGQKEDEDKVAARESGQALGQQEDEGKVDAVEGDQALGQQEDEDDEED